MDLKAMIAAALKDARAIAEKAQAEARDLNDTETAAFDAKMAEVADLKAKLVKAEESQKRFAQIASLGEIEPQGEEQKAARSLGEHFKNALQGRSLKNPGTIAAPEFKAATDAHMTSSSGHGPLLTDIDRNFVLPKRERLVVADLLSQGTVSGNAITYPVFGALEGGTATVAQGGLKPQMHVADPTWKTDALGEIAGWFSLTDDMAEDLDYVVSEINTTALYDLAVKEEAQLLNGTGVAPNLTGILARSGVQTHLQATDSVADAILKGINKVMTATGFAADAVVINPADYEALRLAKDGNDQYYGGGYFQGQYGNGVLVQEPPIWGRTTVVTNAIAKGTVLTGAFKTAKVFRKGGVRVESTNSHDKDFINDKITVRVRERVGLQVKYPAAFVKITLAGE